MKFLIDTNIFIKAEPTAASELEPGAGKVSEVLQLMARSGSHAFVHAASERDIARDRNSSRRHLRQVLFEKYPKIRNRRGGVDNVTEVLGAPKTPNDGVDYELLSALLSDAVDYLVTEDARLIRRGHRLGLDERISTVSAARDVLQDLFVTAPMPPPRVTHMPAYELDSCDAIFESFRADYEGFDRWLSKCKKEHRDAWIVRDHAAVGYAGLAIVKDETPSEIGVEGKVLKVCSLKVSERHRGNKYGELLLKTIFDYCYSNGFGGVYLTVYPKYGILIHLLELFGFKDVGKKATTGERVYAKRFASRVAVQDAASPLAFNVKYGPRHIDASAPLFVVPIQPDYHQLLFPDAETQGDLMPETHPSGNGIRKAYICHAPIRRLAAGDVLLFYRSSDWQRVCCVGVLEQTLVSQEPNKIARLVGKRTVYSYSQIEEFCKKPTLAIMFRHAFNLTKGLGMKELRTHEAIRAAPQSIMEAREGGRRWLRSKLKKM